MEVNLVTLLLSIIFVLVFFYASYLIFILPRKQRRRMEEERRKAEAEAIARHKNPPRVYLPQNRELVGFSAGCEGIYLITKILEKPAQPREILVQFWGQHFPGEIGDLARYLTIVQGSEDSQPIPFASKNDFINTVLPKDEKLVLSQIGCHRVFLTRPAEPEEELENYEIFLYNDVCNGLVQTGTWVESK